MYVTHVRYVGAGHFTTFGALGKKLVEAAAGSSLTRPVRLLAYSLASGELVAFLLPLSNLPSDFYRGLR